MGEPDEDVTEHMQFENPDDELLPVTQCACGATFPAWEHTLSIYRDDARTCDHCGRAFYFENRIRIFRKNTA